jgi:hypothetical protein
MLRRTKSLQVSGLAAALTVVWAGVSSCREPTQMFLTFSTNACGDAPELAVVATPSLAETQRRSTGGELSATHKGCEAPNTLGTLTLTPGTNATGGSFVAVLSLRGKRPEACLADPATPGCITARRQFAFLTHTPLALRVALDLDCEGKACDAFTTCNRGSCVDARVDCKDTGECTEPVRDGGPLTPTDAAQDAGERDASREGAVPLDECPAQTRCRRGAGCTAPEECCLYMSFGDVCGRKGTSMACAIAGCCAPDAPCPAGYECCFGDAETRCVPKNTCLAGSRPCSEDRDCRTDERCGSVSGPPLGVDGVGIARYCGPNR